jgi:hypothetical protein
MIKLLVKESDAFDYHCKLKIKHEKKQTKETEKSLVDCSLNLSVELGVDELLDVLGSSEYDELLEANREYDMAFKRKAKNINNYREKVFLAKKTLQNALFPTTEEDE